MLDVHDAPAPACPRCGRRAAPPGHASAEEEARAAGHRSRAGLVMGHHQAPRPRPRDLVPALRRPRHLLPLRRGLDRPAGGGLRDRQDDARAGDGRARDPRGDPRGQGHLDDLQTRRPTPAGPRRGPQSFPATSVERQPLQRGRVQDPEVRPGLPRSLRIPSRRKSVLRGILRLLQPRAPSLRDRAAYPRVGPPRHRHRDPRPASAHPRHSPRRPPRTVRQPPTPAPKLPKAAWINQPSPEALIQTA